MCRIVETMGDVHDGDRSSVRDGDLRHVRLAAPVFDLDLTNDGSLLAVALADRRGPGVQVYRTQDRTVVAEFATGASVGRRTRTRGRLRPRRRRPVLATLSGVARCATQCGTTMMPTCSTAAARRLSSDRLMSWA
jgi:hypothetical protein